MAYRPRGALARALYDKVRNDQYLEGYDMRLVRTVSYIQIYYELVSLCNNILIPHRHLLLAMFLLQWYTLSKPLPDKYQNRFLALERPDEITLGWLDRAKELSNNFWLQLWHFIARAFLGLFKMSQTSING